MDFIIVALLVLLSGCFSGLTLGFFSLNLTSLERKMKLGDKRAKRIYPIRKNGNLLLCTLLFGNVAVNSAMAIFLSNIAIFALNPHYSCPPDSLSRFYSR